MRAFSFPASFSTLQDGEILVTFRDVPEAVTGGASLEDCLALASDALEEAIAGRIAKRSTIPDPSAAEPSELAIHLSASMSVKAAFYLALAELSFNNTEIALVLGLDEKEVRRLLDPRHQSKITRIEKLLNKLGKRLVLGMEPNAPATVISDAHPIRKIA